MEKFEVSNNALCDILLDPKCDKSINALVGHIRQHYDLSEKTLELVELKLTRFFMPTFKSKFASVLYKENVFRKKNANWLSQNFCISSNVHVNVGGRPVVEDFNKGSKSTKYRKIVAITEAYSSEEIQKAFFKHLRDSGKEHVIADIENLLSETTNNNKTTNDPIRFTEDECISLIEDAKLSKWQYDSIRKQIAAKNADVLIPFKSLALAKQKCYPSLEHIKITEKGADVDLQPLLNHTCKRILEIPLVEDSLIGNNAELSLTMISKWGCDGASGHSRYKQKFFDGTTSDESIFITSIVPLKLILNNVNGIDGQKLIWSNDQPGSTRHCRVINFEFTKESKEITTMKVDELNEKITSLQPTEIDINSVKIKVNHTLHLTMIDGKVAQALTDTPSAASCVICQATSSEMNNLQKLSLKTVNEEFYKYGLSSLHAWIRFMECILHIAYRLEFCRWSVRSNEHKLKVQETKRRIQKEFREKSGLLVDYPKQGSGSSNDGNTARRFFRDPELTAEITKVDLRLIERFGIILQTLACGIKIDAQKFSDYTKETANLYLELHSWYYMPSSVHKILFHGSEIIQHFLLIPIGILTEEAQESRNKDIKHYREFNTRKCSRISSNTDLLHKLLVSSDPYISSLRCQPTYRKHVIDPTAKALLDYS